MRRANHTILRLALLAGLPFWGQGVAVAAEGGVTVSANLTPDRLPFHHVARYEILVEGPAGATIEISPWASEMPGLEIRREAPRIHPVGTEGVRFAQDFVLTPSWVQTYELPPLVVLIDGVPGAELPGKRLEIRDLTPEELALVREPAPLLSLADAEGPALLRWVIATGVLLALVGLGIWRWRRRKGGAGDQPPWALADAQLVDLIALLEARRIRGEAFYVALSEHLRDYVAARFQVLVHERTTPELAEDLIGGTTLDATGVDVLITLLRGFDRVKFAQRQPSISEMIAEVKRARDFIVSTRPDDVTEMDPVVEERQSA